VPGQYAHYEFPGSEDYVKGANRQLSDQMLFGSVYPNCGPLKEVRQIVEALGFANEEIKQKYLQGNARRLLGLATN
jgi:predicted TIM-barrel fold metal-dependent hydrolase